MRQTAAVAQLKILFKLYDVERSILSRDPIDKVEDWLEAAAEKQLISLPDVRF